MTRVKFLRSSVSKIAVLAAAAFVLGDLLPSALAQTDSKPAETKPDEKKEVNQAYLR